ncbi:MAG: SDR family oxidoreductase [Planctomycetota bacterium]|jgi:2-deoxy-D-gluconate 3-dehydrogenase|nr:SDR family oxidoreductase [Planctomycetota bacterium]
MDIAKAFSLAGKTAIVTGAAKTTGLCYGMATALRDAGAKVALLDVSDGIFPLAESLGGAANGYYAVKADLCDQPSREAGFAKAVEALGGRLDILLNGAGLQHRCDAIDFPADKWNIIINVNLSAMFYMCQLAARVMREQKEGGKIINIASMTSFMGSKRIPAYTASKGGVMQLTKALSNEWCGLGINVNAIAPGYMDTELTANMIHTEQGKAHTARIPAGRWGKSEDLQGAVVFLASPASDYVSGAILPVDGGYLGM